MSYKKYTYKQQLSDIIKYKLHITKLKFRVFFARIGCINYDKGKCRFLIDSSRCSKCKLDQCHKVESLLKLMKGEK